MENIVHALFDHAQRKKTDIAFTFLDEKDNKTSIDFGELHRSAQAIAQELLTQANTGERVVLLFPQGLEYVQAFFGCLYAGMIAVPLYPPHSKQNASKAAEIIRDCEAKIVFTSQNIDARFLDLLSGINVITFKNSNNEFFNATEKNAYTNIKTDSIAFLQYTSGSTGAPKGVIVSHSNIFANLKAIIGASDVSHGDIFCNWLPLFHDMGLVITLLLPVYLGCHSVLMSPARFMRNPLRWLNAIEEYKATACGAPNFALDHCCSRISAEKIALLNLSSWRIAFVSAEPISAKTLTQFATRFEPSGFSFKSLYPTYGMAEATVFISGGTLASGPLIKSFDALSLEQGTGIHTKDKSRQLQLVSCGKCQDEHDVKIVCPDELIELSNGRIGEIWFKGPSVTQGYWKKNNQKLLLKSGALNNSNQLYLRTGDLGFLLDGNIFITGRIKDLLIVNGRNIHPQDIERCARSFSSPFGDAIAFQSEGKAVLIQSIKKPSIKELDYPEIANQLRAFIFQEADVVIDTLIFVSEREISKTSSGKLQRSKVKEKYNSGTLEQIYLYETGISATSTPDIANEILQTDLVDIFRQVFGFNQISINDDFIALGGQSIFGADIAAAINHRWGCDLSIFDIFSHAKIRDLATFIQTVINTREPIKHTAALTTYSLSHMQRRQWTTAYIQEGQANHNIAGAIAIDGPINIIALSQAIQKIVNRHDILRTNYIAQTDGSVKAIISSTGKFELTEINTFANDENSDIDNIISANAKVPFDLSRDILLRAYLFQRKGDASILQVVIHHIAADGASINIFLAELTNFYKHDQRQEIRGDIPLPFQYQDYAQWEHTLAQREKADLHIAYWTKQLADLPLAHNIPLDYARPIKMTFEGNTIITSLDQQTSVMVGQLCKSHSITSFMLFYAVLAILVSRYGNQQDIVIGTPISNRNKLELKPLIGPFINLITLRVKLNNQLTFRDLLAEVKTICVDAYKNSSAPFDAVVNNLNPDRNTNIHPLFQIMLNMRSEKINDCRLGTLPTREYCTPAIFSNYDFTLNIFEKTDQFDLEWEYSTELFDKKTIKRIANSFISLLVDLLRNIDKNIYTSKIVDDQDEHLITQCAYGQLMPIAESPAHELIALQARSNPLKTAIIFNEERISYFELNRKSSQLAYYLINCKKIKPGAKIGLCINRSIEMILAIIAVLKAGGAYIPLDPSYPKARLAFITADAAPDLIITTTSILENNVDIFLSTLCIDNINLDTEPAETVNVQHPFLTPSCLAYMIYTSGSTGAPKGVKIQHKNLNNFLASMSLQPGINQNSCILALTSCSFDIHIVEIILPLINGASIVLASEEQSKSASELIHLIEKNPVDIVQATPATWSMLVNVKPSALAGLKILSGGDILDRPLAKKILAIPDIELWNLYGPTETTVWSSIDRITDHNNISIGRPILNTSMHILADNLSQIPIGVIGQLYIGGKGVAEGYNSSAEFNSARFIRDIFCDDNDSKLYKTGDLARWLPDGRIQFIGRADTQIKKDGFRIDLAEIEEALKNNSLIDDVVVACVSSEKQSKKIVAYIKPQKKQPQNIQESIKFSLFYFGLDNAPEHEKYRFYIDSAKFADVNAFHAVWTPERHFSQVGSLYPNPALLNATLAAVTNTIKLRAGSVVIPFNDPIRVAEDWAVIDNLSNGRAGIAVASGWHPHDFVLAPHNYAERKKIVLDSIDILRTLWNGKTVQRKNGLGVDINIEVFPKPLQSSIPIWLSVAGNTQSFINAGTVGANILTHLLDQNFEDLAEKLKAYKQALLDNNHDPKDKQITLMLHTYLSENIEQAIADARQPFINYIKSHLHLVTPILNEIDSTSNHLSTLDIESIATYTYDRYLSSASLIGSPQSVRPVIEKAYAIGVTEIACLVDWMDPGLAEQGLPYIKDLQSITSPTSEQSKTQLEQKLHHELMQWLPGYMAPNEYVFLDNLPLTPNGKVDRQLLIKESKTIAQDIKNPPITSLQKRIASIWIEILDIDVVNLHDDFFKIGGNSLSGALFTSRVQKEINPHFTISELFKYPELSNLSFHIEKSSPEDKEITAGKSYLAIPVDKQLIKAKPRAVVTHFTGSIIFEVTQSDLTIEKVGKVLNILAKRHPILGSRVHEDESHQLIHYTDPENCALTIKAIGTNNLAEVQDFFVALPGKTFSFAENDPLFKAYWITCHNYNNPHLILIWHHWILDHYSTGLLINEALKLLSNDDNNLYADTGVFTWWENLDAHCKKHSDADIAHWLSLDWHKTKPFPSYTLEDPYYLKHKLHQADINLLDRVWRQSPVNTFDYSQLQKKQYELCQLSQRHSNFLRRELLPQYNIEAYDFLLIAIGRALQKWTRQNAFIINTINSGRSPIFPGLDLSQAIGFIAYNFPVYVDLDNFFCPIKQMQIIHQQRKNAPLNGAAFQHLMNTTNESQQLLLRKIPTPQLLLNFIPSIKYIDESSNDALPLTALPSPDSLENNHPDLFDSTRIYMEVAENNGLFGCRVAIKGYEYANSLYRNDHYHPLLQFLLADGVMSELETLIEHISTMNKNTAIKTPMKLGAV